MVSPEASLGYDDPPTEIPLKWAPRPSAARSTRTSASGISGVPCRKPCGTPTSMPICRPPTAPANDTERKVWALLCEQLGERDVLIAGQRVTDHLRTTRSTSLSASKVQASVCVEVKGRRGLARW